MGRTSGLDDQGYVFYMLRLSDMENELNATAAVRPNELPHGGGVHLSKCGNNTL